MIVEDCQTIPLNYYTEGPAIDDQGNIFCTTLAGGEILKIERTGKCSVWGRSACPNGQVILSNGDHLVCDSRLAAIARYNSEGVFLANEILETCNSTKIHVPNDLIIDSSEGIYFTDSIRHEGKVFYRSALGEEHVVATGLDYPNGLILSADESILFVAESYQNRIVAIDLKAPGVAAGDLRIFARLPSHSSGKAESNLPDGIAIDAKNQIWVAHYGMHAVQVLNVDGKLVNSVEIPFPLVSNIFLSGTHDSEVIVTGGYAEPGPGAVCILRLK